MAHNDDDSDAWAAGEAATDRADEHDEPRVRVADVETTRIESEPVDPVRPRAADGGDGEPAPDGHGLNADAMRELHREAAERRATADTAAAERVALTLRGMGVVVDAEADGKIVDAWISERGVNLGNLHGPDADDRAIVNVCEIGPAEMYTGAPDGAAVYVNALVRARDR